MISFISPGFPNARMKLLKEDKMSSNWLQKEGRNYNNPRYFKTLSEIPKRYLDFSSATC